MVKTEFSLRFSKDLVGMSATRGAEGSGTHSGFSGCSRMAGPRLGAASLDLGARGCREPGALAAWPARRDSRLPTGTAGLCFFSLTVTESQFLLVTYFPALEATSFIPKHASGSALREEVRHHLPTGGDPEPSP